MNDRMRRNLDGLVVGLAVFAMFFGAGNLIFPPALGVLSGTSWFLGFLGFYIVDTGLSVLGIYALVNANDDLSLLTKPIGAKLGTLLATAIMICIGPALAIPRTATITYSLGLVPLLGLDEEVKWYAAIFSVLYFLVVYALSIHQTKVVDIIGKILTPILTISILALIFVGIFSPKAGLMVPISTSVVKDGIYSGYQTMDAMGSVLFASVVLNAIYNKGYKKGKEANTIASKAAVVASILLFIIYGGLAYLGATTGTLFVEQIDATTPDLVGFLINIVNALMGYGGLITIAIVVLMACLTTAIGLTTTAGKYFADLSKGKIKYEHTVLAVCLFSALISNLGLAMIISIAAPILTLVYPVVILLILMSFFKKSPRAMNACRVSVLFSFIVSVLTVTRDLFSVEFLDFIHQIPLDGLGINWLIPCVFGFFLGLLLPASNDMSQKQHKAVV